MLYHFCNDTFGAPYRRTLRELARRHGFDYATVAQSWPAPGVRDRLRALAARERTPRIVPDVNAADFAAEIGPDDAGVITGFSRIFKAPLIARFRRLVNVHPSLLPFYRGPSPTYCALANGETESGYTFHDVTPRIDDGPIIVQSRVGLSGAVSPLDAALRIAIASQDDFAALVLALTGRGAYPSSSVDARAVYRVAHGYCSGPLSHIAGESAPGGERL